MASVTYDSITKRWGDVTAVQDLNIEVGDQEFLVFVGPSGSGKSTALRMLAGLEEITEGSIYIGDQRVNELPPKDRNIAMVFQSYALYPHMTVFDNMAFSLKLHNIGRDEIERRVNEAAHELDIGELLERKPKALSGGQRQRVAVGRAIVREPDVFLMDEPLSNLDAKLRVEARALIQRLHHRLETTFIYVTHDQVEAMTMGSRIAVLNRGLLQQIDTPQTLYDYPDNMFVAGFIGSPSMNFFDSTLVQEDGSLYIDTGAFRIPAPPDKVDILRNRAGERIVMGVRPEDVHDPEYQPSGITPHPVESSIDVTELMGNEVFVHFRTGQFEFIGRLDPRTGAKVGHDMAPVFNLDKVHLFDIETEQAIR
ncbi:MAG: ABC transporter ATP-binding protein [Anaerolineae bacterium]